MLDTNCDPSLVANPDNFDQNFDQNFNLDEYFPSTTDARSNSMMPTTFGTAQNDLIEISQPDLNTSGLEGDDLIFGSSGKDVLFGNDGKDIIQGKEGDDLLNGGASIDYLTGNQGNDSLVGGSGNDLLIGNVGNDQLLGESGKDFITGGKGDDYLDGGAGADRVQGNKGKDILVDEDGGDRLNGGEDADEFRIGSPQGKAPSKIEDFEIGTDKLKVLRTGASFENLRIEASENGAAIFDGEQKIGILEGVQADALSKNDFIFNDSITGIQLPDTTGSYSVGTTNYEWVDPMRDETYTEDPTDKRELTVKVWYPTEKVAEGNTAPYIDNEEVIASIAKQAAPNLGIPVEQAISSLNLLKTNSIAEAPIAQTKSDYPVIVFSPGAGGSAEDSTAQAEELASQGYVVVGINHTYDTLATGFADGRIVEASPKLAELSPEVLNESIDIRAADARFVLDQLELVNTCDPQAILTQHLDLEHVGILGYSLGGATAIEVLAQDSRFDAGINMDGNLFKAEARAGSLTQPFMYLNNQVGIAQTPSRQTFYESLPNDAYNVTIDGTAHTSFSDLPFLVDSETLDSLADSDSITPIDPERGTTIINDYNVAFFDKYLKDEQEPLLEAPSSDYPEVTFESHLDN